MQEEESYRAFERGFLFRLCSVEERLTQTHEVEGKKGFTERFERILESVFVQEIGELRLRK